METLTKAKERPVLFSTPMVQAILAGRKTQTRRIVNPQPSINKFGNLDWEPKKTGGLISAYNFPLEDILSLINYCPYGRIGDQLWVKETFTYTPIGNRIIYKATRNDWVSVKWKPSLFMPKAACRLFLEITDISVERLQDISIHDAQNEGIEYNYPTYKNYLGGDNFEDLAYFSGGSLNLKNASAEVASFASLWASINGKESWDANPWVWVVSFKRITK